VPENDDSDVIDPVDADLDPETLRAVQKLVRGYLETEESPAEITDYRAGRHDAFSVVMATISKWLDEIEDGNSGDFGE